MKPCQRTQSSLSSPLGRSNDGHKIQSQSPEMQVPRPRTKAYRASKNSGNNLEDKVKLDENKPPGVGQLNGSQSSPDSNDVNLPKVQAVENR